MINTVRRIISYQLSYSLSHMWNWGSLLLVCLVLQIVTGLFLAAYYIPSIDLAYESVERIMKEVPLGWFVRYSHVLGASALFFCLYIHFARGLYYASYQRPRQWVWTTGVIIFLLMVAVASFGYVLPWASMSYWAATVITSLVTSLPYVGDDAVVYLWGSYGLAQPTLTRIYTMHFTIPVIILVLVSVHVLLLHFVGSSDVFGFHIASDKISFHPYYTIKDILGCLIAAIVFAFLSFFSPNVVTHPLNFEVMNPFVTPPHIVPEWYFLPFHAMLRSIPDKLLGVIVLGGAFIALFSLPVLSKPIPGLRAGSLRPVYTVAVWFFFINFVIPGWTAIHPVATPYVEFGQICTFLYFIFFISVPIIDFCEWWILTTVDNLINEEELNEIDVSI